jgi:hypothetical protein
MKTLFRTENGLLSPFMMYGVIATSYNAAAGHTGNGLPWAMQCFMNRAGSPFATLVVCVYYLSKNSPNGPSQSHFPFLILSFLIVSLVLTTHVCPALRPSCLTSEILCITLLPYVFSGFIHWAACNCHQAQSFVAVR